jgi:predicted site-specific integrase-resolvase
MDTSFFQPPLAIRTRDVLRLLNIGRTTLYFWIKQGKIHPLPMHEKNRMFSYAEISQLARIPVKK